MNTLFITGASGFIGRHLIRRLSPSDYKNIYYLSRTVPDNTLYSRTYDNTHFLRCCLFDSESYIHHLSKSDIVIHLAAITGKAKAAEYFNINAKGTDFFIEKCKQSGVKKFLYISSIATKFKNIKNYPYARSKLQAEECVKASGIPYTILRPTIVIGDGSPVLSSLSKLGNAPVVPIFGDGSAIIQPIFIEDLISCILHIIENDVFDNEILDIGGPEQISIERFISIIHKLLLNGWPRVIHIPIRPIINILKFMEKYFFSFLPFTAGQLASFSNDGTIDRNQLFDYYSSNMKNVDEMLKLVLSPDIETSKSKEILERECKRFTKYLINCNPTAYIQEKYLEGHKVSNIENDIDCFDTFLINAANRNSFIIQLADIYTSVFYRKAVLRKKFVLLLAIIESHSSICSNIDSISENSKISLFTKTIQKALVFSLLLLLSSVAFFPIRAMFHLRYTQQKKPCKLWKK